MKIYIPTMQRASIQHTAKGLILGGVNKAYECSLVIPTEEINLYDEFFRQGFKLIPTELYGISDIRQFLVESCGTRKILMMDDDLKFFTRSSIHDNCLEKATGKDILEMVGWIEKSLNDYAHVGISTRTQNFQLSRRIERAESLDIEVCRLNHLHAFDTEIILGEGLDFKAGMEINTMEDFHMVLNLLELGYYNILSCKWAHNQSGSNTPGGATLYRNLELHRQCALNLKNRHPDVVKIVDKTTISSWGGSHDNPVTRTDVRIAWQKAINIKSNERKLYVKE